MTPKKIDEMINALEAEGYTIARARNQSEALHDMWQQVHGLLRMMTDLVDGGARLTIVHPAWFAETCDYKLLTRSAIVGRLDHVLDRAVVVREARDAA
jgi:hypothetical protein